MLALQSWVGNGQLRWYLMIEQGFDEARASLGLTRMECCRLAVR